jgi:hypothetical protein
LCGNGRSQPNPSAQPAHALLDRGFALVALRTHSAPSAARTPKWEVLQGSNADKFVAKRLASTNKSWRVDETYIRVKVRWCYLYRAIDSAGATIDFLLSAFRDADAAKRLFRKALGDRSHSQPRVINTDLAPITAPRSPTVRRKGRYAPAVGTDSWQAGLPRIPGGPANDSRLRSSPMCAECHASLHRKNPDTMQKKIGKRPNGLLPRNETAPI